MIPMPAHARCLLHIGAPKTGSTAIEKFLCENQQVLRQHGWNYPDVNIRGFGHHDLAFLVGGGYPPWSITQPRSLDELRRDLQKAAATGSRIILSSENFYLQPAPALLRGLLEQAGILPETVRILVYLRRQDTVHESWYNQVVKAQGYTGSLEECIEENRELWDYNRRLTPWADVFGRFGMTVRPYQQSDLEQGDIRLDFLKLVNLPAQDFIFDRTPVNSRINRDILEFQRLVNRLPLTVQEKRRFHRQLIDLTVRTAGQGLFDESPLLSRDRSDRLLANYAESNRMVARTYLQREMLFDCDPAVKDPEIDVAPGLNLEKLTYILGWIMSHGEMP